LKGTAWNLFSLQRERSSKNHPETETVNCKLSLHLHRKPSLQTLSHMGTKFSHKL
jgi:hypothetical protein